jgi:hypothetical protein
VHAFDLVGADDDVGEGGAGLREGWLACCSSNDGSCGWL